MIHFGDLHSGVMHFGVIHFRAHLESNKDSVHILRSSRRWHRAARPALTDLETVLVVTTTSTVSLFTRSSCLQSAQACAPSLKQACSFALSMARSLSSTRTHTYTPTHTRAHTHNHTHTCKQPIPKGCSTEACCPADLSQCPSAEMMVMTTFKILYSTQSWRFVLSHFSTADSPAGGSF